jgi:hypothetical protein
MLLDEVRAHLAGSKPTPAPLPAPNPQPPATPAQEDNMVLILGDDKGNWFRVADSVRNIGATELAALQAAIPSGRVAQVATLATGDEAEILRAASRLTGSSL